ncbi:protein of unknown function [Candidatus Nitrosocosmicus franklandus]|uniref:Uncharacterized protein n=1 Tax=Candidatus Nitrosocosmicus franklandianus TaxID=1798806 RepID=A0A484IA43_9ARCH|nr:protein of unknown function [Candidatus Nitrosocosmicus franklandus]
MEFGKAVEYLSIVRRKDKASFLRNGKVFSKLVKYLMLIFVVLPLKIYKLKAKERRRRHVKI